MYVDVNESINQPIKGKMINSFLRNSDKCRRNDRIKKSLSSKNPQRTPLKRVIESNREQVIYSFNVFPHKILASGWVL